MSMGTQGVGLGDIFIAHRAQLRRIAQRIVGTPEIADEVTQDAYLKLMEGACARDVSKPYSYCCQVVRNLALDHCRRQAVESTYRIYTDDGELPQVAGGCVPDRRFQERQVIDAIDQILGTLPPRTRRAFELYRLGGLTQREVARQMGCSATLVNFMLRDAAEAVASCRDLLEA
ncbi:sigma-70 family RNA polymerase sigma factor [Achromobacter sp. ACM03]|uniref:Probable RNA polymerase sigma factor fecI n=1 Tax=Achromobacter aegrifaciens TaxID=1287736 RepID=A0AAD2J2H6_ACHAE|nr:MULTISPECIES: sigma-70 family RNA polymerase sigma factor [Achromobacter]MBD9428401.1 sigma-70 family RNA polymerase sigma factor [Achromobacter sp. ACM03]MDQ1763469.1 sigma-70 family RNA polymerase sigma factor [Achromobacter aegrifaciens]PTN51859.1 RNA polymerase subunit sigma-70 [Achromobacter xylosoxidans]CUJ48733.1 Probable RNA polymerase sigma factor fecI [Achromobacter aegrifaciens]